MNHSRDYTRILHILKYTRKILRLCETFTSSTMLEQDDDSIDLFSFWLLQIAENAASLSDEFKQSYAQIPWKAIIRFRSIPAHHYEVLEVTELWHIIKTDIPQLHDFVQGQCQEGCSSDTD